MNLKEVYNRFPTNKDCYSYLEELKWGNEPECPYCGSDRFTESKNSNRYHCNTCNTSYSVTVGTIFHRTKIDLQKWFLLIQYNLLTKELPSYRQLSEILEVTKDTVSRMLKQLRNSIIKQDLLIQKIFEHEKQRTS